jgi:hypothetical protein
MKTILKPFLLPFWWQDLLLAIPRIVCGYLLTADFGADKFGLPWSPADKNLGLFEIAFWFPGDVAEYSGIFAAFPVFFAWLAACSCCSVFRRVLLRFLFYQQCWVQFFYNKYNKVCGQRCLRLVFYGLAFTL